ncbi:MAG: acyltransferase [Gammaproteobacteria bacterium]|jgi:peptidoglycan/LPS O-acetylase OafA/YrhL|nr:acyltransferase [Gammaproteobacteria bacterium]
MHGEAHLHQNNINTLRFLGAFFVLWGHTFALCYGPGGGPGPVSAWLRPVTAYHADLPGVGVAMFFVLSGYLVCKSYQNRQSLLVYAEARILRIYPAVWVNLLLLTLVLGPVLTTLDLTDYFSRKDTWAYLLHNARLFPDVAHRLPGVFTDNPQAGGVNGSLWTLPVEVRMYLVVAVLGVTRVLGHRHIFNLVAAAIVIFYAVAPEHFFLLHHPRQERLGLYFLLGAILYVNARQIPVNFAGLAVLSAALVAIYYAGVRQTPYNLAYATWFSYLVLYISFHPRLKLPDLGRHGDFSYGLYLYAFPVTQTLIFWLGPGNPWLILALGFVITLALAMCSWFAVEKPALALKGRLVGRQ